MKHCTSCLFILFALWGNAQIKIINQSEFTFEQLYITPSDTPFKTTGNRFEIQNALTNKANIRSAATVNIPFTAKKNVRYDITVVDTSEWGTYEHTAVFHSVDLFKNKKIEITEAVLPKAYFYYCMETTLEDNYDQLKFVLENQTKYRIVKLMYAVDDTSKFSTARYLAPWAALESKKRMNLYFPYIKSKDIMRKFSIQVLPELNGTVKERQVELLIANGVEAYEYKLVDE
jgi:hypothetical protein